MATVVHARSTSAIPTSTVPTPTSDAHPPLPSADGGEAYATDNGSYGLATLHKDHVGVRGDELLFDYPAKGGQRRIVVVRDPQVVEVVRTLKHRRGGGRELLAYKCQRGRWVDVRTSDINRYLQGALGPDFSTKDFRTWTATVLAAVALAAEEDAEIDRQRHKAVIRVVDDVAHLLGNTPVVARGSYVDPRVIERYEDGETVRDALADRHVETVAHEVSGAADGDHGDKEEVAALDGIPERLLAEIDTAVVDIIDRAPGR